MAHKYELPPWCKEAKKALIDRGMNVTSLAQALGYSREHVSSVINDKVRSYDAKKTICEYLGVDAS